MTRNLRTALLFLIISFNCYSQSFYNPSAIQKIEISFTQPNWDYMLDTASLNAGGYLMAQWVKINGTYYDSVGVKYKGNSSYDSTNAKNPIHVELDTYKSQNYQGFQDIKLSNGYHDPSMMREVLAYNILGNYMHSPQANFAQVYINGIYMGVYSNTESVNKKFCANHFFSNNGTFFKCNPNVTPGTNTKSNLKTLAGDSSAYFNFYELKSNYGWNNLVALCDSVTNKPNNISTIVDVDRMIWMLAYNSVLVNLDSYSGAFCQNYYLYKDQTNHFNPVVWDLNMSFGGFPFVGSLNSSLASQSISGLQNLPINIHSSDAYWPLIGAIYNNPVYKRMYVAHMRTMLNEFFAGNQYVTMYNNYKNVVDTAVQSDTKKFYSYTQFQNGLNTNYSVGTYSVPGIQTLMAARIPYLQSQPEFTVSAPVINSPGATVTTPTLNTAVTITANVTNANSNAVFLGYRFGTAAKFVRSLMYDDGLHNDGAAGDNKYGITFTLSANQAQYYVYAENNNAGIFSPERAEHEFHSLYALASPTAGQIVVNEILANNQSDLVNEFSTNEDWIELYNNSPVPLSLSGFYLTDDYANKSKYAFPANTVMQPYSYMLVWADNQDITVTQVHTNFKLNENGEKVMLSDGLTGIIDSVTFGGQTPDISYGRCPDGSGPFSIRPSTTPGTNNCVVGVKENVNKLNEFSVYPNPAKNFFIVKDDAGKTCNVEVLNAIGQKVYEGSFTGQSVISSSGWQNGIYFVRCNNLTKKLIINN
ncbi:MAG: hypothetical protein K0S32_398 [Bacteroidetes bacterium]|nr:hypothetical protein [Bacteroidota bacterium]